MYLWTNKRDCQTVSECTDTKFLLMGIIMTSAMFIITYLYNGKHIFTEKLKFLLVIKLLKRENQLLDVALIIHDHSLCNHCSVREYYIKDNDLLVKWQFKK